MPIDTVEDLHEHLRWAAIVELTTIPTYLYAMYSLDDPSAEAASLIRSVVTEEMLHLILVGNLLLATGSEPRFYDRESVPSFPLALPHHVPELMVNLAPCSLDIVRELFMVIERPSPVDAEPEADSYETLGQFYSAIEIAVERLAPFDNPQTDRQMADPALYFAVKHDSAGSGGLLGISDVASALTALEIIIHQGEGVGDHKFADPDHRELTHYHKFAQIADGESPLGLVRPVPVNPLASTYPESVALVATFASALYSFVLVLMDEMVAPGADQNAVANDLYGAMGGLLGPTAHYLTTLPIGDGSVAAPTFEFYEFGGSPRAELVQMATDLMVDHPALEPTLHQVIKRWS